MDFQLFNSIAQMLKKNFPNVSDEDLLKQAREMYDKEIQKREEIQRVQKIEKEKRREKIKKMIEDSKRRNILG